MYLLRVRIITNEEAAPKRAKKHSSIHQPYLYGAGQPERGIDFFFTLVLPNFSASRFSPFHGVCRLVPAHGTHLRLRYVLRRSWLDVRFAFSRVAGDASFPISPFKLQPLRAASTGEVFAIARCESRLPSARSHLRTGPNCSPF